MSHLFITLLGAWLLLTQPSTAAPPEWWDQAIQLCGRQITRELIRVCGQFHRDRPGKKPHWRSAEIMPSSLNEDAGTFNMVLEFSPNLPQQLRDMLSERQPSLLELQQQYEAALKNSKPSPEELKQIMRNRQGESEDSSPSELDYLGMNTRTREKKSIKQVGLNEKCCLHECTRRSMVVYC